MKMILINTGICMFEVVILFWLMCYILRVEKKNIEASFWLSAFLSVATWLILNGIFFEVL